MQNRTNHELRLMFQENETVPFEDKINKDATWDNISKEKIRNFLKEADISIRKIVPRDILTSLNIAEGDGITNAGDFVVETADTIYMVETKKEGDMEDSDVQEKTQAALQYCKYATEFTMQNGGKQWRYVLIPHNMVQVNMSFNYLVRACEA